MLFISALDIFKIGIGPSSSHTLGPMVAAKDFMRKVRLSKCQLVSANLTLRCTLKGSLAFTGRGHQTDRAVTLGLHGYSADDLFNCNTEELINQLYQQNTLELDSGHRLKYLPNQNIIFDTGPPLPEHPNGMVFEILSDNDRVLLSETYFSIGGGFVHTLPEMKQLVAPLKMQSAATCPYPFDSAHQMLKMSQLSGLSIAQMKYHNEKCFYSEEKLALGLDNIWRAMETCIHNGLQAEGLLPGGLHLARRAKSLYQQLQNGAQDVTVNDWLCAYAMAVNEENAAGHMVVTAPTNGAAGVIPAVLYYFVKHKGGKSAQIKDFLLTASAIGGIIKHRSSISGAEVGCQGEVGSAAAMAAAGLCAVKGGTPMQVENAAEIALEHHLGMTCDPVNGLVQVPCIERNAFGAIKAYAAAMLSLRGSGSHFMPLDNCIAAMKQTGLEMSEKYKETALGGLAVSYTEC